MFLRFNPLFLFVPLLAACGKQDADCKCPPAVRRVTPAGAAEGSKVVLEGSNFAPNPAANDVRINGAAATVTAASTGELTVTARGGGAGRRRCFPSSTRRLRP